MFVVCPPDLYGFSKLPFFLGLGPFSVRNSGFFNIEPVDRWFPSYPLFLFSLLSYTSHYIPQYIWASIIINGQRVRKVVFFCGCLVLIWHWVLIEDLLLVYFWIFKISISHSAVCVEKSWHCVPWKNNLFGVLYTVSFSIHLDFWAASSRAQLYWLINLRSWFVITVFMVIYTHSSCGIHFPFIPKYGHFLVVPVSIIICINVLSRIDGQGYDR
jgi:hypothetical protein